MRDVAVWPAICWRRWSPAGHSPEHVDFRLERQAALSRCGGFFLVVGSHRFFECGFTQPVGLTRPHLPEILPMIEVDGCWHEFPAVGRWREGDMGACNPLACECVVGCAVLVLRARPKVSNGCLQLFVGPPCISSRAVPVSSAAARLSRFSQQNHSLTHRQTCLSHLAPSRRIQHSAILRSCRQPPSFYQDDLYPHSASHPAVRPLPAASRRLIVRRLSSGPPVASNGSARLQKPAPPRNPGSTPLSDKALDEDDTALEAASSVPPSLQRPVSPARPCPPSLWHTGTQESLVPGPDAWSPAAGSGKISAIRFSFAQSDLIDPWKPLPTHTHTHTYTTPPPGCRTRPFSYTIICTLLDSPDDEKSQSSQPLSNFLPLI